jgi:hypothetical protein
MTKVFLIPYTFTLLNWAAVVGLYHFVHKTALGDIWPEQHIPVKIRDIE